MTKVKVSREVAEAIEFQLARKTPEELLARVIERDEGKWRYIGRSAVLNELTISEMARILYVGYEVEITPEWVWSKRYEDLRRKWDNRNLHSDVRYESRASMETIEEMAKDFGLKIEGVNA